jgi:hypothetical protein
VRYRSTFRRTEGGVDDRAIETFFKEGDPDMPRNYGIPGRGRQASSERTDQIELAQGSHSKRFKVILETLGWFAFMLSMTTVYIVFG